MATDTHEREIRIGRNQALFREVNERIEKVAADAESQSPATTKTSRLGSASSSAARAISVSRESMTRVSSWWQNGQCMDRRYVP